MSNKHPSTGGSNLPEDFFDTDKKGKKEQEDELAKEMEKFEKEMAALQAESEEHLQEEFEKLQEDRNLDELDQQLDRWKKMVELEKKAEELKNRSTVENVSKKFKRDTNSNDTGSDRGKKTEEDLEEADLDDVEDFEDKISNWRARGL